MDSDRLKTIPLFSSMSDKALDTVSVFATETSVSTGKRLVHEGDYSYELIVIESGTMNCEPLNRELNSPSEFWRIFSRARISRLS